MPEKVNRRKFLRGTLMAGAAATGFVSLEEHILTEALAKGLDRKVALPETISAGAMPTGKLGNLTISRILSGGNLLGGWAHSRDLLYVSELMKAYNTEQKQFDTFELLEQAGVNTVQVDMVQVAQVDKYNRERGGHLQRIANVHPTWGLWNVADWDHIKTNLDGLVDQGVDAIYVHGGYADQLVEAALNKGRKENIELIGKIVDYVRSQGLPAGIGSHALEVPIECDKAGIQPDYYFKTFHHDAYWSAHPKENRIPFSVDTQGGVDHDQFHDNIFDLDWQATAEYMKSKKQPWFAFKTLAAGAIDPKEGFKFAFENGADFIVVGMFDFQIAQDVSLVIETLNNLSGRERDWMA
jgi:hypothetical protein